MMSLNCYREIIRSEFSYRVKYNPSYSLRALARDLDLRPSQLSEILNHKVGLSGRKALSVAQKLGFNEQDSLVFKALVDKEHGRTIEKKEQAKKFIALNDFLENFYQLPEESFSLVSRWYHFSILSVMDLDKYDGSLQFIADYLDLPIDDVGVAVKNFIKLDMIDFEQGKFRKRKDFMPTTSHNVPSRSIRSYHKEHLYKAIESLDNVKVDIRDITSMTLSFDRERLPEAKDLIKKFRREFCKIMESGKKNDVYNLNIQLVPLGNKD